MRTVKKTKKVSRMRGRGMGTHGWGARKKHKKSGHRGGKGMSGSGKRNDQKKTLVQKLYGNNYFGKQGITSRGTKRDIRERINLRSIEVNLEKYGHQRRIPKEGTRTCKQAPKDFDKKSLQGAKKVGDVWEINLKNYKILGTGDVKNKLIITAKEASKSAIEKVTKAGGEIILPKKKIIEKKPVKEEIQTE
jgi:large subunit ribosomal protein L15